MRQHSLLCLFFMLGSLLTSAQKNQKNSIPGNIQQAFTSGFAGASDVEWKKKDTLYEVSFEFGTSKKDQVVVYNKLGEIVYHRQDVNIDDLPAPVLKEARSQFPGFNIEDIEKIEQRGNTSYQLGLEKNGEEWILLINSTGQVLDKKGI